MSRFHPSIEGIVPKEERIRVYSEAISFYTEKKYGYNGDWSDLGLCLLLPCIMWNIGYLDQYQDTYFNLKYTPEVFPEIKKHISTITSFDCEVTAEYLERVNQIRIDCLTQCLEEAKNASE